MALYVVAQSTTQGLPGRSINGEASSCGNACTTREASTMGRALIAHNASTTDGGGSSVAEEQRRFELDPLFCFSCNSSKLRHDKQDISLA